MGWFPTRTALENLTCTANPGMDYFSILSGLDGSVVLKSAESLPNKTKSRGPAFKVTGLRRLYCAAPLERRVRALPQTEKDMTDKELIAMAQEAGFPTQTQLSGNVLIAGNAKRRFRRLVEIAQRQTRNDFALERGSERDRFFEWWEATGGGNTSLRAVSEQAFICGARSERMAGARICRDVAERYPTDIFPEDGKSLDCKSARMARLTAANIEREITERSNVQDSRPAQGSLRRSG